MPELQHPVIAEVDLGNVQAVFTGRHGGRSEGDWDSFNLGLHVGDVPRHVASNRELLIERLPLDRLVTLEQVHGRGVIEVRRADTSDALGLVPAGSADCLITADAGLGLLAMAADCVPIALASGRAAGVVHAGWRGLAAGVIDAAVERLGHIGGQPVHAAIGPSAGPCCYEVSAEVIERVGRPAVADGRMLDLQSTALAMLVEAGASVATTVRMCTMCDAEGRFFSHRRDGSPTGRQGVVAWSSG